MHQGRRHPQDESQDSQLVTLYMHRLHGRSSSPLQPPDRDGMMDGFGVPRPRRNSRRRGHQQQPKKQVQVPRGGPSATVKKNPAAAATVRTTPNNFNPPTPPTARAADASNNRASNLIASSQQSTDRLVNCQPLSRVGSHTRPHGSPHDALNTLHRPARPRLKHDDDNDGASAHRRKMDSSQSPTQSNDDRSYEQYLPRGDDLIPPDGYQLEPSPPTQQSVTSSADEDSNRDHDTSLVNFDFSAMDRQDTQVSYPDPYDTDRPQQTSPVAFMGLPETPAPPRNPFADSKASLMAASQMFRQTQPSSALKTFSPTSSRPSPDNIQTLHSLPPHPATSSPLKQAATISSPLLAQFPDVYQTSPRHESQENHPPLAAHKSDPDLGHDLAHKVRRQRQRGLEKGKSTKQRLRPIALPRPPPSDEIVPSTNRETMLDPATERRPDPSQEIPDTDSQRAVEDSQVGAQRSQKDASRLFDDLVEKAHSSNEDVVPNTASSPAASAPLPAPALARTSPELDDEPRIFARFRPRALGDMMPDSSAEASKAESFTNLLGSSVLVDAKKSPQSEEGMPERSSHLDSSVANTPLPSQAAIAETSPPVDSSPPPPAFSTRARMRGAQSRSSEHAPTSPPPPASSYSSLSRLGTTPELSDDENTPATEESPRRSLISSSIEELEMSPAVAKANRRKDLDAGPKPDTSRRKSTKARSQRPKRSLEFDGSTDELARSPSVSTPVYPQNARVSRYGRASLKETPASRELGRLFAGMAFAISFQSRQVGEKDNHYNSRIAASSQVATKIKQGGGRVLANGFDQLFEVSPVKTAVRESKYSASTPQPDDDISLAPSAQETGFTALIADGHSRKVKYMQALALGLPCIHERWVTTCVEKQKLVDWSDYLLCAGNSAFLGDAIRSRSLAPYDAATAQLAQTIRHRPRLLDRSRVLLIMSRAEEQKKMAYVFLARVLGASLSRVYTTEEARKQLKAREDAGDPYDWVYLEENKTAADGLGIFSDPGASHPVAAAAVAAKSATLLSSCTATTTTTTASSSSRKRKRRSEANKACPAAAGPPPKRIRTLSDELVIQSLILGRLMDEDEI